MPCEDYPCCGHEPGDCPRIDKDGNERWRCASCSKELPLNSSSSLCKKCIKKVHDDVYSDDGY